VSVYLDGSISWVHAYLHTGGGGKTPRPAPRERPDTGGWAASRGIAGHRLPGAPGE